MKHTTVRGVVSTIARPPPPEPGSSRTWEFCRGAPMAGPAALVVFPSGVYLKKFCVLASRSVWGKD